MSIFTEAVPGNLRLRILEIIEELQIVPNQYFKKLVNTDNIWEVRVKSGSNIFRLLGFFDGKDVVVLTNGFVKKDTKNS